MKKTMTAFLLSVLLSAACFATVPYSLYTGIGSLSANTGSTDNQFSSVWEYWSQGGSKYNVMRRWGCHAVAHSKLLVECGAASGDVTVFNPDVYFDWGCENGYYDCSSMLEQYGAVGPCSDVITYAKQQGVTLKKVGTVALSGTCSSADAEKITSYLDDGYYVIVTCKAHQAYVGRAASAEAGKPILLDSWGSKSYYDGTCVEFVGYNLAGFTELMYFSVGDGESETELPGKTSITPPELLSEPVEEPDKACNPDVPAMSLNPDLQDEETIPAMMPPDMPDEYLPL